MVMDGGLPTGAFVDAVTSAQELIDLVKFGWGTALVTSGIEDKIRFLEEVGVDFYFGGTLGEKFLAQGRFHDYLDFCASQGCRTVEISNGTVPLDASTKAALIRSAASAGLLVLSEVGQKDLAASDSMAPGDWVRSMEEDFASGASYVIAEARESGRSGVCDGEGNLRTAVIEAILASGLPTSRMIFEAPTKALQTFFVTRLGPEANLGNVPIQEVIATETLRLGLRSDTLLHFELEREHFPAGARASA